MTDLDYGVFCRCVVPAVDPKACRECLKRQHVKEKVRHMKLMSDLALGKVTIDDEEVPK